MSLKGKVYCEDPEAIGGFESFVAKLKQAIGQATGTDIGTDTKNPFGNLYLEGIVQGDIKLQAVNDWKTTSYYGFTDALKGLNIGGGTTVGASAVVASAETNARTSINGAAMLKFANTVMNVLGYTLGGTGPASKKMYGGSNLNGFAVQFKWYTPYMEGWFEAIQALCYLAWPTSVWNADSNPEVNTRPSDPTTAQKDAIEAQYVGIIDTTNKHLSSANNMRAAIVRMESAAVADNWVEVGKLCSAFSGNNGFTDLNQIYITLQEGILTSDITKIDAALGDIDDSIALDNTVLASAQARSRMQLRKESIGSDINSIHWYDNSTSTVPVDPSATEIDGGGETPAPKKEEGFFESLPGGNLIKAGGTLLSAGSDLIKGLVDSFAKNPPKVCLEIYDYKGSLKYRFSPLVITSFGITASRETIDGDPVIVTIDIGFDYFQVNATNAIQAPSQMFAGAPIFNKKRK